MMLKRLALLLAFIGIVIPTSATSEKAIQYTPPITIMLNSIIRIHCGEYLGTATIVADNTLLTASHVVAGNQTCSYIEQGIEHSLAVLMDDPALDYAILEYPEHGYAMPYKCDGMVAGQQYMMVGFAKGQYFAVQSSTATSMFVNISDRDTGQRFYHVREMAGYYKDQRLAIKGMSGGPIIGADGMMVGTIQANSLIHGELAFSRELKDTILCDSRRAPTVDGSDK